MTKDGAVGPLLARSRRSLLKPAQLRSLKPTVRSADRVKPRMSLGVGKGCRSPARTPAVAASRLRSVSPAASDSCWQATALSRHSKIWGSVVAWPKFHCANEENRPGNLC
jgi:hypothetical protein